MALVALFTLAFTFFYFISCRKGSSTAENTRQNVKAVLVNDILQLESISTIGDVYLPEGTTLQYTSQDSSEASIKLPAGYAFLKLDSVTGSYVTDTSKAIYFCKCTGKKDCIVMYFVTSKSFGCLQQNCTGNCIGGFKTTQQKVVGVVYIANDHLEVADSSIVQNMPVSEEGMRAIVQLPAVQAEAERSYDSLYAGRTRPDFSNIDPNNLPSGYFIGGFTVYGVKVGLVLPNDEAFLSSRPELRAMAGSPIPTCTCSDDAPGKKCELKKSKGPTGKVLLIFCWGCKTCTMTIKTTLKPVDTTIVTD